MLKGIDNFSTLTRDAHMKLKRSAQHIILLMIFNCIYGCSSTNTIQLDKKDEVQVRFSNLETQKLGSDQEWGLALSGGGIRSAVFQIGVLKQLYDTEIRNPDSKISLKNIKVISSVSGGSYASHWLYMNHIYAQDRANSRHEFGYFSLDDVFFAESICQIYTRGNFVVYPKLLWATLPPGSIIPSQYYQQQILRTFGAHQSPQPFDLSLHSLLPQITKDEIPYPIINFTIGGTDIWKAQLFEVTPIQQGNEYLKYHPVKTDGLSFGKAAAISGAAIKFLLEQQIDSPSSKQYGEKLTVFDGGKSENLGAFALIRRGIPNIIVSDAGHDPDMTYNDLLKLLNQLDNEGFIVKTVLENNSQALEKQRGFRHYQIKKDSKTINMYYIKMQLPTNVFYNNPLHELNKGYNATEVLLDEMRVDGNIDCSMAQEAFGDEHTYMDWLRDVTLDYESYLNRGKGFDAWSNRTKLRLLNIISFNSSFFKYRFPHMSTSDQSLMIDQALSLIGLGYMQTELLIPYINDIKKITETEK